MIPTAAQTHGQRKTICAQKTSLFVPTRAHTAGQKSEQSRAATSRSPGQQKTCSQPRTSPRISNSKSPWHRAIIDTSRTPRRATTTYTPTHLHTDTPTPTYTYTYTHTHTHLKNHAHRPPCNAVVLPEHDQRVGWHRHGSHVHPRVNVHRSQPPPVIARQEQKSHRIPPEIPGFCTAPDTPTRESR